MGERFGFFLFLGKQLPSALADGYMVVCNIGFSQTALPLNQFKSVSIHKLIYFL